MEKPVSPRAQVRKRAVVINKCPPISSRSCHFVSSFHRVKTCLKKCPKNFPTPNWNANSGDFKTAFWERSKKKKSRGNWSNCRKKTWNARKRKGSFWKIRWKLLFFVHETWRCTNIAQGYNRQITIVRFA